MKLNDYDTSDPVYLVASHVTLFPKSDTAEVALEVRGIRWEDIAWSVGNSDDDFVECFIRRVKQVQKQG